MRALSSLFSLVLLAGAAHAAPPERSVYIVSLEDAPVATYRGTKSLPATAPDATGAKHLKVDAPASRAYLDYLDRRHGEFLDAAKAKLGREVAPRFRYRVAANGMAVELDAEEAKALASMAGVVAVRPDRVQQPQTDAGPPFIGADALWNGNVPGIAATRGEGAVIGVVDSGLNFTHPSFAATGADGYTATNPRGRTFGLCQTTPAHCSGKVIGVYDFTSEGAHDGTDTTGHGSHVASTAAGNVVSATITGHTTTVPLTLSGVAPHASLIVYKACRKDIGCYDSETMAALDQAASDGVDVVNYSIGSLPEDPWTGVRTGRADVASAMLNLRGAGVVPIVSAGNDGPAPGTAGYPANAPWVVAVAAANHNRRFATSLADLAGPAIATTTITGESISGALGTARVVDAADFGFPLCGTGTAAGIDAPGSDNPFPAGTFHGEIVVCRRGVYARVNKGFNVKAAGAGGMVLANTAADAESIVADDHYLPAVHIGFNDAQRLYGLLAQVKQAGGSATASITGTQRSFDARGDVLAGFSSRGPVDPFGGWLKPNITAPGVNIIAASQTGNGLATMSGTSMASPHAAGAAALVRAAHPQWSVAQIESALLTHGIADVLKEDAATPATPADGGAGRVWIPDAVRAQLTFDVSSAEFRAADPLGNGGAGGPSTLNMPYLVDAHCRDACTLTRTVTDNGGGSAWRAELHLPAGAQGAVTPSSFTLGSGARQSFAVSLDVHDSRLAGSWVDGDLTLVNTAGGAPDVKLPVEVYADPGALPSEIRFTATSDGGFRDTSISGLVALSNPRFVGGGLAPVGDDTRVLPQDPTPADLFKTLPRTGAYFTTVPLPRELDANGQPAPATLDVMIYAETSSPTARDVDLYVGIDDNGDGKPQQDEAICFRQGSGAAKSCRIHRAIANAANPPVVWFLEQNVQQGTSADSVRMRYAVATLDSGLAGTDKSYARYGVLRASGPGRTAANAAFDTRLSWSTASFLPGESWMSLFAMSASPNGARFGFVPVFIDVSSSMTRAPKLMSGLDDTLVVRLPAGASHDRVAIDVPPNAGSLTAGMSGTGSADLYVAKSSGEPAPPAIGSSPPVAQAAGSSTNAGSGESVTVSGAALTPGRWYVMPANTGGSIAEVTLRTRLAFASSAASTPDAAYFDPDRSGHGLFLNTGGDQWVAFWYTYLQDGTPAWYLAQAPAPASTDGVWSAPLYRYTWDGATNAGSTVGRLDLVRRGDGALAFDWQLDGTFGSEPFVALTAPGANCAQALGGKVDFSGAWFAPAHSGYGYSVITNADVETEVAYLYDTSGNPRWLYGQNSPFGSGTFALTQYTGFCPTCAYAAIQGTNAGQLVRTFTTPRSGTALVTAGAWQVNDTTAKLTNDIMCR